MPGSDGKREHQWSWNLLLPFAAVEEVIEDVYKKLVDVNGETFQASFDGKVDQMANAAYIIQWGVLSF